MLAHRLSIGSTSRVCWAMLIIISEITRMKHDIEITQYMSLK